MKKFLIVFLLLNSCEYEPQEYHGWLEFPVTVEILTDDDYEVLDAWNDYFGVEIFVPFEEPDETITLSEYRAPDCSVTAKDDLGSNIRGHTYVHFTSAGINVCRVFIAAYLIDPEADPEIYKRVLAHELGHGLGIQHTNDPDSLMYYSAPTDLSFDELLSGYVDDTFWDKYRYYFEES